MSKYKNRESFYYDISKKDSYKEISKFFDCSGATNPARIGYVANLCKKYAPNDFEEWCFIYETSQYYTNMLQGGELVKKALEEQGKTYEMNTIMRCLMCFVLYNTYKGCEMEIKAYNEFLKNGYRVRYATREEDYTYAVDLFVNDIPIQVKPLTYIYIEKEKKEINETKNQKYKEEYGKEVLYLYYDSNREFGECMEIVKNLIAQNEGGAK